MMLDSNAVAQVAKALDSLDKQAQSTGFQMAGELRIGGNVTMRVAFEPEAQRHVVTQIDG